MSFAIGGAETPLQNLRVCHHKKMPSQKLTPFLAKKGQNGAYVRAVTHARLEDSTFSFLAWS